LNLLSCSKFALLNDESVTKLVIPRTSESDTPDARLIEILRKTALTNAETSQNLVALDLIKPHVCYITYKWIIRYIIKDLARNHRSHHILNIKLIKWR
jgi:hypothetical protein